MNKLPCDIEDLIYSYADPVRDNQKRLLDKIVKSIKTGTSNEYWSHLDMLYEIGVTPEQIDKRVSLYEVLGNIYELWTGINKGRLSYENPKRLSNYSLERSYRQIYFHTCCLCKNRMPYVSYKLNMDFKNLRITYVSNELVELDEGFIGVRRYGCMKCAQWKRLS